MVAGNALPVPPEPRVEHVLWSPYPVHYDVAPPERPYRRLRTLFRPILLLPAAVALGLMGWFVNLITMAAWFIVLFSGRYERSLWGFGESYVRRQANFLTSMSLVRDELPPVFGDEYAPVAFSVAYPERQSRLKAFFRYLLALPLIAVLYLWAVPWVASVTIAWVAILVTGRYPEGLRRLVIGLNRWAVRVQAYLLLLRDEYPGFTLGLHEAPPPRVQQAAAEPAPYLERPPTPSEQAEAEPSWLRATRMMPSASEHTDAATQWPAHGQAWDPPAMPEAVTVAPAEEPAVAPEAGPAFVAPPRPRAAAPQLSESTSPEDELEQGGLDFIARPLRSQEQPDGS